MWALLTFVDNIMQLEVWPDNESYKQAHQYPNADKDGFIPINGENSFQSFSSNTL